HAVRMRRRFGADGSGGYFLRPGAGRQAIPFFQAVLRSGWHRSLAGSAGALGAGIRPRLFRRPSRDIRAGYYRSRVGAADAGADPRPIERTAQAYLACTRAARPAADTPDRRT